jgi:Reverse transcriptase (RNA-dependent DNA polymerase)
MPRRWKGRHRARGSVRCSPISFCTMRLICGSDRTRLVRYADDFLLTFEQCANADRMAKALAERLAKFGLRLHEDKTRLIEFGRFASAIRRRRGEGRPETFYFLGFAHFCGKTLNGRLWSTAKPNASARSGS